jgi:tetratricopeptide (TPR) repeat protein
MMFLQSTAHAISLAPLSAFQFACGCASAVPFDHLQKSTLRTEEFSRMLGHFIKVILLLALIANVLAWPQALTPAALESLRRGLQAQAWGDLPSAIQALEEADRVAPNDARIQRPLLFVYLQAGNVSGALRLGQAAVQRWPEKAEIHHGLGLAYFKSDQNEEARAELTRAAKLAPGDFGVQFDLALVMFTLEDYRAASLALETALKLDSKDAMAHVLLGRAYQNTNRSAEALQQFRTALKLDPAVHLGHYHLGFAYESLGESEPALEEYRTEIARNPNHPEVRYRFGHCLLEMGQWQAAIEELQRAADLDGRNANAYYDLGKAFLMSGETEKAIAALKSSTHLNPTDSSPHYLLARALEKAGDQAEADLEWAEFHRLKTAQPARGGMATGRNQ